MRMFRRAACACLAAMLLLTGCGGAGSGMDTTAADTTASPETTAAPVTTAAETTTAPVEETAFVPVLRFAVVSDTHISKTGDVEAERMKKLFASAYRYAEADVHYNKLDALVVAGDLTNDGLMNEFKAFDETVKAAIKDGTELIPVMGNHDLRNTGSNAYKSVISAELNLDRTINGFHFIGISPSQDSTSNYDASAIKFMRDAVAAAAAESPEKPIFTFQHHHIKDTVYVSSEWYTPASSGLRNIYDKYPQVINFSGHSHGPINTPTSIWQDGFTALGTGTLSYFEMTSGMTYGTIPPKSEQAAQYYIVEVSADNAVRILPYNILTDSFFRTPANTDDADEQLVYTIEKPTDKSSFRYVDREKTATAPTFDKDAKVTVVEVSDKTVKLYVPQAKDSSAVYGYEIVCRAENHELTFNYFSEFYLEPMPETMTFELKGLKQNRKYTVSVTPYNCFALRGEPITAEFTTAVGEVAEYTSVNPVNFVGTFTNFEQTTELKKSRTNFAYGGNIAGDLFVGAWNSASMNANSQYAIAAGKGYNGSAALALSSKDEENQGLYLFATTDNKNTDKYPDLSYLRVWVDFTDVSFRKGNFGLVSPTGGLFTTDEGDDRTDQAFWYLPEGKSEWIEYKHGTDGCFGEKQDASVKGFRGWMAFPIKDFLYRKGTGKAAEAIGDAYHESTIAGVYMFWDYADSGYIGKTFYLDEVQIVEDYRIFDEYKTK